MGRFSREQDVRGSEKWLRLAVKRASLDGPILEHMNGALSIRWVSPLETDGYSEYRDAAFLDKIACRQLSPRLADFWPAMGPQWDALGLSDKGDVLLVEAKAHVEEMCTNPCGAEADTSLHKIEHALAVTQRACHAAPRASWTQLFYQLGNRLAHLYFLRNEGVDAWLVLVDFIGDVEMNGPMAPAEWDAAYAVAYHVMGLKPEAGLMQYVFHVRPDIKSLG